MYYVQLPMFDINATNSTAVTTTFFGVANLLYLIYTTIAILFLAKVTRDILLIYLLKKRCKSYKPLNQERTIFLTNHQNFSFFNWIFIKEEEKDNSSIIEHESAHAKQWHSLDILFIKVVQVLFWYNPLVFMIEKALRLQHEYAVDKAIVTGHTSLLDYQQMLLNQVFGKEFHLITNSFNQTYLKNRIIMMTKDHRRKSGVFQVVLLALIFILPLVYGCSFETENQEKPIEPIKTVELEMVVEEPQPVAEVANDTVYTVVEQHPCFPGGEKARITFLSENIIYPQEAKDKGVSGRVFAQFIVEKDGTISNVKILRGIGSGCDEEVLRVVALMPKWNPGVEKGENVRVTFTMPMKFALN